MKYVGHDVSRVHKNPFACLITLDADFFLSQLPELFLQIVYNSFHSPVGVGAAYKVIIRNVAYFVNFQ